VKTALELKLVTIGLTGNDGGNWAVLFDITSMFPTNLPHESRKSIS